MRRRPSGSSEEEEDGSSANASASLSKSSSSSSSSRSNVAAQAAHNDPKSPPKTVATTVVRTPSMASRTSVDADNDGPRPKHLWPHASHQPDRIPEKEQMALLTRDSSKEKDTRWRLRLRNPWSTSLVTVAAVALAGFLLFTIVRSFMTRQLDPKGYRMSYMRSAFVPFPDFDTEHTRFATKYNLYMYREVGVDEDPKVKGVPVLFIPGNAGSYKQVRSLASEAAIYFQDSVHAKPDDWRDTRRPFDFFTVDFNEDITAFHGQTLLDQAEYLNDAIAYILALYHNSHWSQRDSSLPDPCSVILVGHSMGGVVARTMLTMPNYQANTINTIITLSAPHARPPVSFDADIVRTYKTINDYWRRSYSQQWGNENPLWHVTLISIAGGGLDTIVPSDYASIASLVPETHGFTVFTSTMPNVWTGMDHLSITWCDQLRKSVIHALFETIDVRQPGQTRRRAERMRVFKKWFLTGLEDNAEKTISHEEPRTLLTLEDNDNAVMAQGERLTLRTNGQQKPKAYLMPVPPLEDTPDRRKFTLLSDKSQGTLDVLFCSVFPHQPGQASTLFSMNMDMSGDNSGSTRLACKSAMSDIISLPASTEASQHPFDIVPPVSFLQYDLESLAEHQFVAVVDKSTAPRSSFVVAEFSSSSDALVRSNVGLPALLTDGLHIKLPASRPMMVDIKLAAVYSSLLAFKLRIGDQQCPQGQELFKPLLRQYITDVYESRFFVNARDADVTLHGVAPYMPPSFRGKHPGNGLSLQLWADPTCQNALDISLQVDIPGSMGKLWMRYRTLFAALPLLVVALAMRKQFKVYDESGTFMSFSEALNQSLKRSFTMAILALGCLAYSFANIAGLFSSNGSSYPVKHGNGSVTVMDYAQNEYLLGNSDSFFWFLMPMFGLICFGICTAMNWSVLAVTQLIAVIYGRLRSFQGLRSGEEARRTPAGFAVTSTRQRIITTSILLVLVSTVIPYQFAYLVLCLVQIATCVRAWRLVLDTQSDTNYNFYNYAHSILILMLWILPINMPVLVVWIRNLAVHWLTPFSSHHNIICIMPYILVVETLSTGRMVPRVTSSIRAITNTLFFVLAIWAAVFGVSYAYQLHHFVNGICAWLILIHLSTSSFSVIQLVTGDEPRGNKQVKKRP